jgi:para-nitrobenzyl esterase
MLSCVRLRDGFGFFLLSLLRLSEGFFMGRAASMRFWLTCLVWSAVAFAVAACGEDEGGDAQADTSGADSSGADSSGADSSGGDSSGSDTASTSGDTSSTSDDTSTSSGADTSGSGPQPALVNSPAGPIAGEANGGVREFLGIPYAEPPVGERRWRPSLALAPWTDTLDATQARAICPQSAIVGSGIDGEEDCLFLNVWTPDPAPEGAPVMVWIHGGGFRSGSGSDALYDGRKLAAKGVVVVNINYRLGPLGMMAHSALTAEDVGRAASGNYGLEDQQLALKWVRDNIDAFGGDPDNVTIFGESAGAFSACYHLVMPESAGLFDRAIFQSGPCVFNTPLENLAQGEALGAEVAVAVGCDTDPDPLACLRSKTQAEIITALPPRPSFFVGEGTEWRPILDGHVLPTHPAAAVASGDFTKVPVIVGSNADEGTLFLALSETDFTQTDYEAFAASNFGDKAALVLAEYPASDFASVNDALATVIGDSIFVCGARATARALAAQNAPVFLYHFTHPLSFPLYPDQDLGAFHAADVPFVFQNPFITVRLNAEERALSDQIQGYWTRFAATGDPNGADAVAWPAYDATTDQHLTLDLTLGADSALKKDRCDFWDTIWAAP